MPSLHHKKAQAQTRFIAKEDLEPGDVLLRHYVDSLQAVAPAGQVNADANFSNLVTLAQDLLLGPFPSEGDDDSGAKDSTASNQEDASLPLLVFLTSLFDGGGYTSAALVTYPEIYSRGEMHVLEVFQGQVQSTPLAEYPEEGVWALRYCGRGIAMGDSQLPPGPVVAKAHHLHAIIEAGETSDANGMPQANSELALLMLAIWRRCGSFRVADIQKYLLSVFMRPHKDALDAFFAVTGATLQKILQREALKAAEVLRSQYTQISPEFVAAAFNQARAGEDYKISRGCTPQAEPCPVFDEVSRTLVEQKLAALSLSINQHDALLEVRKAEHVYSMLDGALGANASLFLPSDFANSINTFPLGMLGGNKSS